MRLSNFELLRLLAMLMVMNLHTFSQPKWLSITDFNWLTILDFFRESTSVSAVNLFVVISGYFSIQWKLKSFTSLVFQLFFWTLGIYFLLLITGFVSFDLKTLIFRINCIVTAYWFVTAYIGLYLLAPVLNSFVEVNVKNGNGEKKILLFLFLYVLLQTYYQLLGDGNFQSGYGILSLCGCYMIGRYIRVKDVSLKRCWVIMGIILSTLGIMIVAMGGRLIGKELFIYNNPLVLLQTIFIFLFFKGLRFESSFVNYCSSSAFAVYLLHMHPDLKAYYFAYARELYQYPVMLHLLFLVVAFVVVFVIAILVDKMRLQLFECFWGYCIGRLKC